MTDRIDINRLLVEMRTLKSQTQAFAKPRGLAELDSADMKVNTGLNVTEKERTPGFGELLEQAVNQVHETQKASGALQKSYELGDPNVDITDVMVASQKASVSFQAMLQVRNKLVEAYRDVMNMPI